MRRSSVILALTFCSGAVNALPLPADDLPSIEVFPLDVSPTNTTNTNTTSTNTTTSATPAQNSTTPDSGDQITSVKIFDLVVNDDAPPPPSDAVV